MKLVTVAGTMGSGKTSLIRALVAEHVRRGKRSAVIVNEEGEVPYDEAFVGSYRVAVERLRGG